MESLILYFFLLVLGILLNLGLNTSHKQGGLFKTLLKEGFKFVSNRRSNIIAFKLSFVLLLVKVDFVLEE